MSFLVLELREHAFYLEKRIEKVPIKQREPFIDRLYKLNKVISLLNDLDFITIGGFNMDKKQAYENGKDAILNGANTINSSYENFTSVELKDAWEKGYNEHKK